MRGFAGKRFSWLLAGPARFEPYGGTCAPLRLAPRALVEVPRTLAHKLEELVQTAYDAGDQITGRHLAGVLGSMRRRAGQVGSLRVVRIRPRDPRAAPPAANDP